MNKDYEYKYDDTWRYSNVIVNVDQLGSLKINFQILKKKETRS
jgi:hypothetical protein